MTTIRIRNLNTHASGYSYKAHNPHHNLFFKDWFAATSPFDYSLQMEIKRPLRVFKEQYRSSGSKRIGKAVVCLISYKQTVMLEMIQCNPRSKGIGGACLQTISNLADKHQITMCLEASPPHGFYKRRQSSPGSAAKRLRKFYEKFGFRVKKSPFQRRRSHGYFMVREPMIAITH